MADETTNRTQANINFERTEIAMLKPQYDLIKDVLAGSTAVKNAGDKGDKYLPRPNADDTSSQNIARYAAYVLRAVLYNFTKRTLKGLIGQIFLRAPELKLPPLMSLLETNMSGSGVTTNQFAKGVALRIMSYGRCGVFVDYPDTDVPATVQQVASGKIRPAILQFNPWEIINWRTIVRNGEEILSLVVIRENVGTSDDGFETKFENQWRVLQLVNDTVYTITIYKQTEEGFYIDASFTPKDAKGNTLDTIPFIFGGVENNDPNVDDPPLFDLADLNIAHYRNSADYEDACYLVGQPTPVLSGLTKEWVDDVLKGSVQLGSRASIALPVGAQAMLLQASPNTMPFEAMGQKERQAVALGAKLVEQKSVQRTLGEAELEEAGESSVLADIGVNTQNVVIFALQWAARFMGADPNEVDYKLTTEFDLTQMDAQQRAETVAEWQAGIIVTSEARNALKRAGTATLSDEEYQKELVTDDKRRSDLAEAAAAQKNPMTKQNLPGQQTPGNHAPQPTAQ